MSSLNTPQSHVTAHQNGAHSNASRDRKKNPHLPGDGYEKNVWNLNDDITHRTARSSKQAKNLGKRKKLPLYLRMQEKAREFDEQLEKEKVI